ncbi:MAG: IPT/TIG domain-containing protein [Dehalococcoidales bacterium]|nr:IPT/TIG domain-containing protein [Dehalococcoidales bacterium]
MKYRKFFGILLIAFTLSIALLPPAPALAQNLRLDLESGEVGDTIEAYGNNFEADQYQLYFSDSFVSVGGVVDDDLLNYERLESVSGSERITIGTSVFEGFYFTVPRRLTDGQNVKTVLGGTYYVYAVNYSSKEIVARALFTVEAVASFTLDPDNGTVGTEVEINGQGFGDEENISVEYDGDEVDIESGDDKTDSAGKFENTKVKIPSSTAGSHTISITGADSDVVAEAEFTVESEIAITPESGAAGSAVTVSGTGFGDMVNFTIKFDGDEVDIESGDDETDGNGSFEVSVSIPLKTAGDYTIEVEDSDNNQAEAEFSVGTTTFEITPTTGRMGTEVSVDGSGFLAETAITVTFDTIEVATDTTDEDGDFSTSFTVPENVGVDTYTVEATDGTNTKEVDFTISTSGDISPETSASSPGNVGTPITVTGAGFIAGRTVTITYEGNQVTTAVVNTDGSFSATFNAPASSRGEHIIVATDGTNTMQFPFIMESTAPQVPQPQKPEMDVKAKSEAYFDWADVTDPSGVTYTLQIATSDDFSSNSIVLEKAGISSSEFTVPKADRLQSVSKEAPYYWRVKAVDGAANESQWTGTWSFYVGTSLGLSQPVIYILIGVGALFLGIFGFWLGRRTAYY